MAGVFDLELHDEDNIRDSDDDVIEVDDKPLKPDHDKNPTTSSDKDAADLEKIILESFGKSNKMYSTNN